MLHLLAVAACIAFFLFLVTSAAALTYTAICMIAGGGVAWIAAYFILSNHWEKQQQCEHKRLLEIVRLARMTGANVDIPTLESDKTSIPRIGKRASRSIPEL